jgi:hypothetical protein
MVKKMVVSLSLAGLLAVAAFPSTGCYGSFALTKKLHTWNGQVSNKWVNTLIFWAFIIIPVYEVCTLADGIVINVIEFWSGKNIVGGGTAAAPATRGLADGSLEVTHEGKSYTLVPASADRFYLVAGGTAVGSGRVSPQGDLTIYVQGRAGEIRYTHQQLQQLGQKLAAAGLTPAM